jgi:hypothetical protein
MAHVCWSKGGEADVLAVDGERVQLRSTAAAAPGTPLEGKLAVGSGKGIRVKVARCRREQGAGFVIEGRLLDAARELRAELQELVVRE